MVPGDSLSHGRSGRSHGLSVPVRARRGSSQLRLLLRVASCKLSVTDANKLPLQQSATSDLSRELWPRVASETSVNRHSRRRRRIHDCAAPRGLVSCSGVPGLLNWRVRISFIGSQYSAVPFEARPDLVGLGASFFGSV